MKSIKKLLLLDYQSAAINKLSDEVKGIQQIKKSIIYVQNLKNGRDAGRKARKHYTNTLLSLGGYLKKHGIDVFYLSIPDEAEFLEEKIQWADAIYCWSTTPVFPFVKTMIRKARELKPSLITILGGYHASGLPEKTLEELPQLDIVTIGESEKAVMKLCEGIPALQIEGLAFREGTGIFVNRKNELLEPDEIPAPDYSLLNGDRRRYRYYLQTMYSCPFHCKYCVYSYFWGKVRFRSDDSIRDELIQLKSIMGISFDMHILDTIVNYNPQNVKRLTRIIQELGMSISFSADIRPEYVNKATLSDLEALGVKQLFIGFEDANNTCRENAGRFMSNELFINALSTIKENSSILADCYWMLGLPGTSTETMHENAEFAGYLIKEKLIESLCPDTVFVPLPGTPFYNQALNHGILDLEKDWSLYRRSNYYPVYKLDTITQKDFVHGLFNFDKIIIREQLKLLNMNEKDVLNLYFGENNRNNVEEFLLL